MRDEAHVGLVDAHAKGDGRDDHHGWFAQERRLVAPPHRDVEARVVGQRVEAAGAQEFSGVVYLLPREAVHDAGVSRVPSEEVDELREGVRRLLDDGVPDVRTVEAAHEDPRRCQAEPPDHVLPGQVVGRRRQRDPGHRGIPPVKDVEAEVLLPEVVAPLADAVRLVDRDHAEEPPRVQRVQLLLRPGGREALGRHVYEVEIRGVEEALDADDLGVRQRGVEVLRSDSRQLERADLVLHERDERADDDGDPVSGAAPRDRGELVAQALAPARRHQDEGVAPVSDVLDDVLLRAAEAVVAEDALEDVHVLFTTGYCAARGL